MTKKAANFLQSSRLGVALSLEADLGPGLEENAMNEREIFAAAAQIENEAERAAYLDQACGSDTDQRSRLDKLLTQRSQLGSFMEHPLVEGLVTELFRSNTEKVTAAAAPGPGDAPRPASLDLHFLAPARLEGSLGRLGQYEILEVVGCGGMGIVFKARDTKLHRVVAVKVLAPELAANATARQRFSREAQAAAAVSHDHVVTIYAVEENESADCAVPPYLVMEFIDGQSLQQKIDREGPLELKEILRIGRQMAAGLAAAHQQGLIHRDVKPANILLQNGIERVQITDFGLARAIDDVAITQTGQVAGTPAFMSPEQAQGHPVDPRSDLFSLGSVLYAMCTGRSPFRAESTMGCLRRVCDDTPRPIREVSPDIPTWLVAIIERLLAKNPDDRYQTAEEVAEVLGQGLAHVQDPGSKPRPVPIRVVRRLAPPALGGRGWLAAASLLLALTAAFGVSEATGVTHLSATVIRIVTGEGTLVIEVDDPSVQVTLDGEELKITGAGIKELKVRPGQYELQATKGGQVVSQELVKISRSEREVVKVTLEPIDAGRTGAKAGNATSQAGVEKPAIASAPTIPEVRRFQALPPQVGAVAFSPDGRQALTGGGVARHLDNKSVPLDYSLQLWDVERGTEIHRLSGHRDLVHAVAFSPDGRRALSGSDDGTVRLWNIQTGDQLQELNGHNGAVLRLAFLPDGKQAVSVGDGGGRGDDAMILWDLDSGEEVRRLDNSAWAVLDVAVSDDGRWALCGLAGKPGSSLALWDLKTGELVRQFESIGSNKIASVAFLPGGARAVSCDRSGTIRIWDLPSGRQLRSFVTPLELAWGLAVLPDGRRVIVIGHPGAWLYDLETGKPMASFEGDENYPGKPAVSADGEWALAGSYNGVAHLWRIPESVWPKESAPIERDAFVVLSGKGAEVGKFDTLADAVLGSSAGDTIEIRDNGPFVMDAIKITHPLTIRAGIGHQPVLVQSGKTKHHAFFAFDATLVLEGLELKRPAECGVGSVLATTEHGPLALFISNCRLVSNLDRGGLLIWHRALHTEIRNSVLIGGDIAVDWNCRSGGSQVIENCVVSGAFGISYGGCAKTDFDLHDVSITFHGNTVTNTPYGDIALAFNSIPTIPEGVASIDVEVEENIFTGNGPTHRVLHFAWLDQGETVSNLLAAVKRLTRWQAQQNLCPLDADFIEMQLSTAPENLNPAENEIFSRRLEPTADDDPTFWGVTEKGYQRGVIRFSGGNLSARSQHDLVGLSLEQFRLRPDSAGYQAGPDGKDLGADIDLVGPGEAYERWKQTLEYQALRQQVEELMRPGAAKLPAPGVPDAANPAEPANLEGKDNTTSRENSGDQ